MVCNCKSVGFDNVKLSLDWVPQGEHGGYFQAIAKGYYAEHNIELKLFQAVLLLIPKQC
ncbi:MAG: hypothetical protein CM15mP70_11730 [Pelagibacteraceae bacterium]|nr:MAG: hypothetical protein CM15mP70_11730 [Pelagibacteraceae bacterium]